MEEESAGPGTPDPLSEGGSPTGKWMGRIRAQLAQPTWAQTLLWPQLAVLQMYYLKVDLAQHHHPAYES